MSDSEVVESKKRGRPSGTSSDNKTTPKKRPRAVTPPAPSKKEISPTSADHAPVKRGRGRPKGSFKKNGSEKSGKKSSTGKSRGRPPKPKKDESTEEDDTEENDDNDDDNDDNETGSDA